MVTRPIVIHFIVSRMSELEKIDLKSKLKEVFGYNQFRGNQEAIIRSILANKNTFVIMPTGAGKSLCYQLPAVILPGAALVISPLIALMKNQVDQLNATGINAYFLNSTLSKSEITRIKKEIMNGQVKLVYVAPESLVKEENLEFFRQANISFIAVDEAHCISEWGHDFRPEYRKIRQIVEALNNLPVIALTATATPKVQLDIVKNLQIEDTVIFKSSFLRSNLYYEVVPKRQPDKQLIKFVKSHKGQSGIVYCSSRKKVEEVAQLLSVNDIKALPYHAGMDSDTREKNQDAFLNEEADVIVATIAFGMGIDKPDVRFVVHYDAPKSLEGYYQETGRAGRDGLEGKCLMLYSYDDITKLEKYNKDKPVTERDNARFLLQEVVDFAECAVSRPKQLLHYFGEEYDETKLMGMCDNTRKPRKKFDVEGDAVLALKAAVLTENRFGTDHLADVLGGVANDYVKSYGHDELAVFGKGKNRIFPSREPDEDAEDYEPLTDIQQKEHTKRYWRSVIRQLMLNGFLEKDIENYGVLRITPKGEAYIKSPYPLTMYEDHDFSKDDALAEIDDKDMLPAKSYDEGLFELLKNLRKKIAKEKNLPPYVIFQDPSLEEMATIYPTTDKELAQINGVGGGKVAKFGKPFIDLIKRYVEENDITTATDVIVKSAVNKSKTKIFIIQQIDRRVDLEEIAEIKGLTMEELISEIEHICYSGTKLNLSYYIDPLLDKERQKEIFDYFMNAESDKIADAYKYFEGDYSEEELRLMRVRFLSEVAN
jgi:ATP-dependent DNA helicase RecQ